MSYESLGDRMKAYEKAFDKKLAEKVPVIIRCDGKRFSKWTKTHKFDKPFDELLSYVMSDTMIKVAQKIDGCVFGYTQSDEITFVLRNDQSINSEPWLGNRIQKLCSIVSSMVTSCFNESSEWSYEDSRWTNPATFDARVFLVPSITEAVNCLVWRQNDSIKNSVQAACYYEVAKLLGRKTTRKLMSGLNQAQQKELLTEKSGLIWENYLAKYRLGVACYKKNKILYNTSGECFNRKEWVLDEQPVLFSKHHSLIESRLNV